MKKLIVLFVLIVPSLAHAQNDTSVTFVSGLTWKQILSTAKAENKIIFVDCFATWCAPCKMMDKDVYPLKKVGDMVNRKFLSVKIQMDSTDHDKTEIKSWYKDAHELMVENDITAFPSYLFFLPTGEVIHKDIGYKSPEQFLSLAKEAVDPQKQYYTLYRNYNRKPKDYSVSVYLVNTAIKLGDKKFASKVATDYIDDYLLAKNTDAKTVDKSNIIFIGQHVTSARSKGFQFIYKNRQTIDSIAGFPFSDRVINYVVQLEEILPQLWLDGNIKNSIISANPDWSQILATISEKYDQDIAERNVINAQINWFKFRKEWDKLAIANLRKIEKLGIDTSGFGRAGINNMVWDVFFEHITDTLLLRKGIKILEVLIKIDPEYVDLLDTYSNLLYKTGEVELAIAIEEKAYALHKKITNARNQKENPWYAEALSKMRTGVPTWKPE